MKNILSKMARIFFLTLAMCHSTYSFSQDSARQIEPAQTTSFDNYKLLILAILGLLLLIGIRFWFKRAKKR